MLSFSRFVEYGGVNYVVMRVEDVDKLVENSIYFDKDKYYMYRDGKLKKLSKGLHTTSIESMIKVLSEKPIVEAARQISSGCFHLALYNSDSELGEALKIIINTALISKHTVDTAFNGFKIAKHNSIIRSKKSFTLEYIQKWMSLLDKNFIIHLIPKHFNQEANLGTIFNIDFNRYDTFDKYSLTLTGDKCLIKCESFILKL